MHTEGILTARLQPGTEISTACANDNYRPTRAPEKSARKTGFTHIGQSLLM
jgi:hypothetical protein